MRPTILATLFLGATTALAGAAGAGMSTMSTAPGVAVRDVADVRMATKMTAPDVHAGHGATARAADDRGMSTMNTARRAHPGHPVTGAQPTVSVRDFADSRMPTRATAPGADRAVTARGFDDARAVTTRPAAPRAHAAPDLTGVDSTVNVRDFADSRMPTRVTTPGVDGVVTAGVAADPRGVATMTRPQAALDTTLTFHDSAMDSSVAVEREIVDRAQAAFGRTAVHSTPMNLPESVNRQIVPGNRMPANAPVRPVPAALGDLPTVAGGEWIATGNHLVEVTPDQRIAWVVYDALP